MNTQTSVSKIRIITHNGCLPKDGGIRLGYQAWDDVLGWVYIPIAGGPTLAELVSMKEAPSQARQVPEPSKVAPDLIRFELLCKRKYSGHCPNCGGYVDCNEFLQMTDVGEVYLYRCNGCNTLLRDYWG